MTWDLDMIDCDPDEPTLLCVECGETLDYPEDEDVKYRNLCGPCSEYEEWLAKKRRNRAAYWDHVDGEIDKRGAWRKRVIG